MALRRGHGTGAGQPRIEVLPPDELPTGVATPEPQPEAMPRPPYRKGSAEAREAGRRGGKAKAGQTRLSSELGIAKLADAADFAPYKRAATPFAKAQRAALASSVGGGVCGPGPSSMVASAALQLAASRYLSDRAAIEGDAELFAKASRLADASRQNLLAAHELCAREAKARAEHGGETQTARVLRQLREGTDAGDV